MDIDLPDLEWHGQVLVGVNGHEELLDGWRGSGGRLDEDVVRLADGDGARLAHTAGVAGADVQLAEARLGGEQRGRRGGEGARRRGQAHALFEEGVLALAEAEGLVDDVRLLVDVEAEDGDRVLVFGSEPNLGLSVC